ncbi:MAG: hypothetical protein ACKOX6_17085 [Bdellovibrio sp.]
MKQVLLTAILLGASLNVHAGYQDVIQKEATQVRGASSCMYAVTEGSMHEGASQEVIVYVNSDEQAHINGSIRLTPEMLPLQEGQLIKREGLIVEYKDGVLSQYKRQVSEGLFVNDYSIVKVKVSADLKVVEAGYVKKATKGLIREIVLGEMSCRF